MHSQVFKVFVIKMMHFFNPVSQYEQHYHIEGHFGFGVLEPTHRMHNFPVETPVPSFKVWCPISSDLRSEFTNSEEESQVVFAVKESTTKLWHYKEYQVRASAFNPRGNKCNTSTGRTKRGKVTRVDAKVCTESGRMHEAWESRTLIGKSAQMARNAMGTREDDD
ncbi:uncharacterized protein BJ212DRAFT_1302674 [Suillus subaureus]|uniref:Uncharacterized protein n=1 Tax=Suillus subaureus TaxID=48587 RepID=A0A9P7J947_9AGAM|nr:uncharacterized protein BJ212DRAFT_1302674 [Suillus subaureus]KAG1809103.1 hypothetical protein BJ212DRAFT_1302674 [Suillus subaureus]